MFRKLLLSFIAILIVSTAAAGTKIVYVDYHPNGKVKVEVIKLKKGLHKVNHYSEAGVLEESGFTKNGMFQGRWVRYGKDGDVLATAYYHNNVKIGAWNHVDQWTNSRYQVSYENGLAVSFKKFDQAGQLVASGSRQP